MIDIFDCLDEIENITDMTTATESNNNNHSKKLANIVQGCYVLKKTILAPTKLDNGMMRLVKIHKGTRYNFKMLNCGTVTLAKSIADEETLRGVIKMPVSDFKTYFKEVLI